MMVFIQYDKLINKESSMFGESHDLATEFPEFKDKIHILKMEDRHFARLFE